MRRYVTAVRDAQSLRMKFLPHLYTLIFKCSTTGDRIVRPLFFEVIGRERSTMADTALLELTICLDGTGSAEGELITPQKEAPHTPVSEKTTRLRFFYARNFLAGYCSPCVYGDVLGRVTILGLTKAPSQVELNGKELDLQD
ncbi:hypothetical protein MRX96_041226 [Rhipicephalus microplus]